MIIMIKMTIMIMMIIIINIGGCCGSNNSNNDNPYILSNVSINKYHFYLYIKMIII